MYGFSNKSRPDENFKPDLLFLASVLPHHVNVHALENVVSSRARRVPYAAYIPSILDKAHSVLVNLQISGRIGPYKKALLINRNSLLGKAFFS